MKTFLTILCVTGLNGALLYPLLMLGAGRPFSLAIEVALLVAGAGGLFLLYRFRRSL